MIAPRHFKSWNIFDCGLVKVASGHHHWETKAFVEEIMRRGDAVHLFTHRTAPEPKDFFGVSVTPTFSLTLYQTVSEDPTWSTLENFIVHNRAFAQDLSKLDSTTLEETLALFPTVDTGQLLGILRWLGTFSHESGPKAAICLIPPTEWRQNHMAGLYKTMWGDCSPELKKRIALFCRTPQMAERFVKYLGMPVQVLPFVMPQDIGSFVAEPTAAAEGSLQISFVGGARRERGIALLPGVVKRCSDLGIPIFVQVRAGEEFGFDMTALTSFSGLPHVHVHEGPLERSAYYRVIANSVSLLPYEADKYVWRDSGVYLEGKILGAPALVPAGTWMADEVSSLGNGLVIKDHTVEAVVDCIAQAKQGLPTLRAAAARVRGEFHRSQGAARCIEAIANAFASPGGHQSGDQRDTAGASRGAR